MLFKTGETIPESGIYRVVHEAHRLPHEVTLRLGQQFPRCSRCGDGVVFELIRGVQNDRLDKNIVLYSLPEIDDDLPMAS